MKTKEPNQKFTQYTMSDAEFAQLTALAQLPEANRDQLRAKSSQVKSFWRQLGNTYSCDPTSIAPGSSAGLIDPRIFFAKAKVN